MLDLGEGAEFRAFAGFLPNSAVNNKHSAANRGRTF
jgi:hypothetical protein